MERAGLRVLMFTDIEGSTPLLQRLGPRYVELIARHDAMIRSAVADHHGRVVDAEGDGYFVVFDSPGDALGAALDVQLAMVAETWPEHADVRVRMGLHVGDVWETSTGLVGLAIHHAARIAAAAHGGQVIVSDPARALLDGGPEAAELRPLGVHQLRDVGEIALFQLVHPGLADQFPPLRSVGGVRNNLPAPRTSMVGRDNETAAVSELLLQHRLVTLVGAGGCGKTRLAIRVASETNDAFPDGVRLVELAALSDPASVPAAVVAALGANAETATMDALIDLLRDRHSLIVLDNCEHLLDVCATLVAEVLARCAHVTMLAASREPVGVSGEVVYRVPSMAVAPPAASLAELRATDSARLFEERVGLVRPGFVIVAEDAPAIGEICRRLDGIPLAIELAAARCRLLSPRELLGRLDDRFRLLTGGARDALPRQQTLLATIDWSYRLLSEPEQVLLARLAVFHGGATLEAVDAVCAGSPIDGIDLFELVGSLVDKSLLRLDDSVGLVRVELPETIRQYAVDRLVDRPELGRLRELHAEWFGSLVGPLGIGPWARTRSERAALARADQDNLAAAFEWATAAGRADALRVVGTMTALYPELRDPTDFGARIRVALDSMPDAPLSLRAVALARLAWDLVESASSSVDVAEETGAQALALARESGDPRTVAEVATWAGFVVSDADTSTAYGIEGVAAADASGDPELSVHTRIKAFNYCDLDTGVTMLETAEVIARREGLDSYRASIAINVADMASLHGNGAVALNAVDEALRFTAAASYFDRWESRTYGAIVLADQGRYVESAALIADAHELLARVANPILERETRGAAAHLARLRLDATAARCEAEGALDSRRTFERWTEALALLALAAADRIDGDPAGAVASLLPILTTESRRADIPAQAMEELAACLADLRRAGEATRVFATAVAFRRENRTPLPPGRRTAVEELGLRLGPAEPFPIAAVVELAQLAVQ